MPSAIYDEADRLRQVMRKNGEDFVDITGAGHDPMIGVSLGESDFPKTIPELRRLLSLTSEEYYDDCKRRGHLGGLSINDAIFTAEYIYVYDVWEDTWHVRTRKPDIGT